jgi:Flp pilus assembly protein TadG
MTRLTTRSLVEQTKGTTSLEFGLTASALMLIMVGGLELAVLMWQTVTLQAVASQTARCAAIAATGCSPASAAKQSAVNLATSWLGPGVITTANVTITASNSCGAGSATGDTFEIVRISPPAWTGTHLYPFVRQALTLTACYPT